MILIEEPHLTHVRLLVQDFPGCFGFYRDAMGFKVQFGTEDGAYAEFEAGDAVIGLYKRDLMAAVVGASAWRADAESQDRVALVFKVVDVNSAKHQLERRGASFVTKPADKPAWGIRAAHLRDPDGNLLEIYQDLIRR